MSIMLTHSSPQRICGNLLLFLIFLVVLSQCGSKEENQETSGLNLSFHLNVSYILPGNVRSCADIVNGGESNDSASEVSTSIVPPRVQYRGVTIDWKKDSELTVVAIVLEFKNTQLSGDKYTCSVDGEALHTLFAHDSNYKQGVISAPAKITSNENCYLHCGGIQLKEKEPSLNSVYIIGTATLLGYSTKDGLSIPIRTSTPVILGY